MTRKWSSLFSLRRLVECKPSLLFLLATVLMKLPRFRWVTCQLEALRHSLPSAIRRALDHLPESLDETYDRILKGIPRGRQEYAQLLFQCVAESIRPLRVEELADILAIEFEAGGELPRYHMNWRPDNPEEEVISICSSLITIVDIDGSRVVRFSHFSVKEYLTSERLANTGKDLSRHHILSDSAHTILAKASLSVLLSLDDQVDKDTMKNFPFAIYAARHWVDHARLHDVSSRIEDGMERLFDPEKPYFATWVWIHDIDYPFREMMFAARPSPPNGTPLYYATLCGFRDLVEHLIITYPGDINTRGGYECTPLHAAVVKRDVDIVVLLLEHGADMAAWNQANSSPLDEAARRGRVDMIRLLLHHHADVHSQDDLGRTPLFVVSQEGELEAARALLQHGAAVDPRDKNGWTPLILASECGHLDVLDLLLQNGAAVDSRNKYGSTSLMYASCHGHPDLVCLLLQKGANVNSCQNNGQTPLMLASEEGHLDVVHLLLQNGANVDSRDQDGCTPLACASQNGHPDVVRLLLQNGAIVDPRDNEGRTPLMCASQNGHPDAVRLLLQGSATVDSRHNEGWTSLMFACENGFLDIVRLLLQNGAAVDSHHNDNPTLSKGT